MTAQENDTLIIFTEVYPHGEVFDSFLDSEIPYLSSVFQKIIIVPKNIPRSTFRTDRKFQSNVLIDNSYLQIPKAYNEGNDAWRIISLFLKVIKSRHFYREIAKNIPLVLHQLVIVVLRDHLYNALQIENWTINYIKTNNLDLSKTIFYTYWFNDQTTGIAFAKKQFPSIKLISRAHRHDLYIEIHNPPYIPFRHYVIKYVNSLFLISEHGKHYIFELYPQFAQRCEVSKLGVRDPHFSTQSSNDGILRIVSCSNAVPVKRIDLIILGLAELSRLRPNQKINWVHIGDGPILQQLKELSEECLSQNIEFALMGYLQGEVIQFYEHHCIDIFMNTSASEGIPVTIMEAQSCGIPVIATNVGGTSEIISNKVGVLLSETPTPLEIASAICTLIDDPIQFLEKKHNSKENWKTNYNAERNFSAFARHLKEI